ncbi:hypothetical protein TREMEDRAFT_67879 [Tremella mesenterica DSM 1558]|uniref:uncharacterized protein n=1 Tax=Tremella mesenterica (strain ATCC 24925 / CBS 8224 / DSM 1558 / NBRC 9311 / NRRL Y-6157 / RJB 2259-6 / UBC 559-6) TaxID=578456 RepID=UPI0003F4A634|nr:uncharacterized protein TREMEDRAFT_67879 [Tremella mesenterica DSM 1558]EIW71645.1 hypothetical protein TREMEDRAFT_67879 [Tremella mesenterica DSM 1558]
MTSSNEKQRDKRYQEDRYSEHRRDYQDDKDHDGYRERKDHKRHKDDKGRKKEREGKDDTDEERLDLDTLGVNKISEEDYFVRSNEFRYWLKHSKGRYLDELSSDTARNYFGKFVRRWNSGSLEKRFYKVSTFPPGATTNYRWSFANPSSSSHRSPSPRQISHPQIKNDVSTLVKVKIEISKNISDTELEPGPRLSRLGPSLPSAADRQLALEQEQESRKREKKVGRDKLYERVIEVVPKNGGREGKMEERRATNAANKEMREKDVVPEIDEGVLLGENDSFAAALRARNIAESRRMDKKAIALAERRAADEERLSERRSKEAATMNMFKAIARERFG